MLAGIGFFVYFIVTENYHFEELKYSGSYFLSHSLNQFTLYALVVAALFTLIWIFYDRVEGWLISGCIAGAVLLPVAYYLNKNVLPGRFEPISLIGNGLVTLCAIGLTLWLFFRWFKEATFIARLYNKYVLFGFILILGVVNGAYFLKPAYGRLASAPAAPDELIQYFDQSKLLQYDGHNGSGHHAADVLWAYFNERAGAHQKRLRQKLVERDSARIVSVADSVVAREFTYWGVMYTLPERIDWRANPARDEVWIRNFNRQDWLWELASAYLLTGDPKYARDFDVIMTSWFEQNHLPAWKNEGDPVWRLLETGIRLSASWVDAFMVFFTSDEVRVETKWRMLASIHDHAEFLTHFRSPRRNHLLDESFGLLAAGAVFPEFKMADQWRRTARDRLDYAVAADVYPDGGYNEGSIYYHRFVIRILQEISDFADEYGVKLSEQFYENLERMYAFLMNVAKPDGVIPQSNDGFFSIDVRNLFEKSADMFDREDFRYFNTGGEKGTKPARSSIAFPYTGFYVMKSDWSEQARYMLIDAGLFGSAHGHEDKLNFQLFAYGKPFIVESGTFTYQYNRWRHFFTSSFAHNTITVDDRSQLRMPDRSLWITEPPAKLANVWVSNASFDYLEARYQDGYGNKKEDVVTGISHVRRILFVKPDYWIIWDTVTGQGRHKVQSFLHLPAEPAVQVTANGDCEIGYQDGPELLVRSLLPEGTAVNQYEGSEDPIQGWVAPRYGVKVAAPVIQYEVEDSLPVSFVHVLFPFSGSSNKNEVTAEWLPVSSEQGPIPVARGIAIRIASKNSRDEVMMTPNFSGEKTFAANSTTAQCFIIRTFQDGTQLREELASLSNSRN